MQYFTILGHSDFFGNVVDIIHALGGQVDCVLLTDPGLTRVGHLTVDERVSRIPYEVSVGVAGNTMDARRDVVIGFLGAGKPRFVESLDTAYATLIHPSAIISPTAKIGSGVIIDAGCIVGSHATLEDHVALNRGVTLGHDTHLARFSVVRPGAHLAGHARLGREAVVSMGACVVDGVTVGQGSVVAANAAVTKDVPPHTMVAGVPASVKKRLPGGESDTVERKKC